MKTSPVNVAVVGASGNVGREILSILLERAFPMKRLDALASARSHGKQLLYGDNESVQLQNVETYDFDNIDIVLSSAGATAAEAFASRAVRQGAVVIDNSSRFRMEDDVPLVVPEVNGAAAQDYRARGIIANPNCSTIQMVMALKPLHDLWGLQRISVATYQSTSGAGRAGMDELFEQTKAIYQNKPLERDAFPKQIAFNVIPQIDVFMADGSSKEEWKMCGGNQKNFCRCQHRCYCDMRACCQFCWSWLRLFMRHSTTLSMSTTHATSYKRPTASQLSMTPEEPQR